VGIIKSLGGAICVLVLGLVLSASASADISFCGPGPGAGQCAAPEGISVDNSTGHVYVADENNRRVDVFSSTGSFLFAFGWGVADGSSAELQTCTATCFAGLQGGGAGEFAGLRQIAVDPAAPHDVYVFEQFRVQEFTPNGEFVRAWGGGTITGGATGKGDLTSGLTTVNKVSTTSKAFKAGQGISGAGIPAGTRIVALGPGTITLSKAATATALGVTLTASEGPGNKPVNEVQVLESLSKVNRGISFSTEDPSPSTDSVKTPLPIPNNAPASGSGSVQEMLEGLSNIDPGDISVAGPNGGPYAIEFTGRYADTDVDFLKDLDSQGNPERALTATAKNGGGSFEICTNAGECAAGVQGSGEGQFSNESEPIAVGFGGSVYVGDNAGSSQALSRRIEKFEPSGTFVEEVALPGTHPMSGLAVGSGGNLFIASFGAGTVEKYSPSGVLLYTVSLNSVGPIAVGPADHLFAAHPEGQLGVITELDSGGLIVRRFGYGSIGESLGGIAVNETGLGDIYGSEPRQDRVRYLSFPPAGPLPCCTAVAAGNTKAVLKGAFNPEGKASTYHFEYVDQKSFEDEGGFASPKTVKTLESAASAANFSLSTAEAQVGCSVPVKPLQASCLIPETSYRFRLVAKNEVERSVESEFETLPFFEIKSTWATDVRSEAAKLHAAVNPLGIAATGFFEYVDDATYQADLSKGVGHDGFAEAGKAPSGAPISFGEGEGEKAAETEISALAPNTTYHYRLVAADPFLTKTSTEHTLRTRPQLPPPHLACPNEAFRAGPSASLPDCRAYELVSPVDKNGGDIKTLISARSYPARLDESSDVGDNFTYSSVASFADPQGAPYTSQYMATRQEGVGWSTQASSPAREAKSIDGGIAAKLDIQYKAFAADLSSGWLIHDTNPPLDSCAPAGFINLYRRDNASGSYEALSTAAPASPATPGEYLPELQGISADGSHAVFRANGKLTSNASDTLAAGGVPIFQLYEHLKGAGCGQLRLVSVLPDGSPSGLTSSVGARGKNPPGESRGNTVVRGMSADGARIFWSNGSIGGGALFVRIEGNETVEIAPEGAQFWTAASDGSKVIYSVGEKLYEAQIAPGTSTSALIAEGFEGVAGASEDASRVYFVSTKALGGQGEAGKPNLYLHEAGGASSLVATLYPGDGPSGALPGGDLNVGFELSGFAVGRAEPVANGVRVTPDGAHLAFVSAESLTSYDNADVADGLPNLELYLYDIASGKVACVSCNPSGGRPAGRKMVDGGTRRVSAQMAPAENQLFAPRALSEDGNRLFFESFEALLGRDENNAADVYEWERAASQQACDEKGAELFVSNAGGCLSLISSGEKESGDSELADASPDGSDVFIRTASSLLPQDPGQVDIYDAREGGGFPPLPARSIPCETPGNPTPCQSSNPPPNDPTLASTGPSSGNVKPCPKGKVRRKGKCVKKPHKHQHPKRANDKSKGARR
jgi:hypothetical protein